MENITTYPEELAEMFATLAEDRQNKELKEDLTKAFEWIQAAAANPYNSEYWRTLYKTLDKLAYRY